MYKVTELQQCLPCDANTGRPAVRLTPIFEVIAGARTWVAANDIMPWRSMPFHLLCTPLEETKRCSLIELYNKPGFHSKYGSVAFIPAGTPHCIRDISGHSATSLWIHFKISVFVSLDLMSFYDVPNTFSGEAGKEIAACMKEIVNLPYSEDFLNSVKLQFLGFALVKKIIEHSRPKTLAKSWQFDFERLQPVLTLLNQKPNKRFTIAELSKKARLSPSRFFAVFHAITGSTPGEYAEHRRITLAVSMLTQKEKSISRIAAELGYYDVFHFSKHFKRVMGVSPANYKKCNVRAVFGNGQTNAFRQSGIFSHLPAD